LLLAGNSYRSQKDLSHQRGGILVSGVSVTRCDGWVAKGSLSRCQNAMHSHIDSSLGERVPKQIQTSDNKRELFSPLSRQCSHGSNFKLNACKRSHCYLSSAPFNSSGVEQRKANKFHVRYKAEEYEFAEPNIDRLQPTDGTGEAILLEGNLLQTSPWWQQFPKRWVIVLLCFTAFLLCNMDRVSTIFLFLRFQLHNSYDYHCRVFSYLNS
jgi:MFS transporter, ACS family, solute carrier family 17 (sodium-dependent inorganic phosphate cotransporter), other